MTRLKISLREQASFIYEGINFMHLVLFCGLLYVIMKIIFEGLSWGNFSRATILALLDFVAVFKFDFKNKSI